MSLLFDVVKSFQGKDIDKSDADLYSKRVSICNNCPFQDWKTRSCGKLFVGGTVDYNGEKKKLCGCRILDKAQYKHDHCPLYKW